MRSAAWRGAEAVGTSPRAWSSPWHRDDDDAAEALFSAQCERLNELLEPEVQRAPIADVHEAVARIRYAPIWIARRWAPHLSPAQSDWLVEYARRGAALDGWAGDRPPLAPWAMLPLVAWWASRSAEDVPPAFNWRVSGKPPRRTPDAELLRAWTGAAWTAVEPARATWIAFLATGCRTPPPAPRPPRRPIERALLRGDLAAAARAAGWDGPGGVLDLATSRIASGDGHRMRNGWCVLCNRAEGDPVAECWELRPADGLWIVRKRTSKPSKRARRVADRLLGVEAVPLRGRRRLKTSP